MILQAGVKILLKNKEDKYLLVRRSSEKYPEVGAVWDIVGGRIEAGTALLENLKREIFEETKLELIGEPKLIAAQDILKLDKHVVRLTYIGEAQGDVILDEENTEYKWFRREELYQIEALDAYLKEVLKSIE